MKYTLVLCLWLVSIISAFSQQQPASGPAQATPQQIDDLVRANRILREDLTRLQKDHDDLQEDFEEYEPLLKNWQWLFGGLGIVGLLGWFLGLKPYVKNKVEKEVDETIKSLLTNKREDFLAILNDYDHDRKIKEKHTLILISPQKCNDTYHFDLLTKHLYTLTRTCASTLVRSVLLHREK
jgi:phosphoglycerate-specific signal transduction histidine kinase